MEALCVDTAPLAEPPAPLCSPSCGMSEGHGRDSGRQEQSKGCPLASPHLKMTQSKDCHCPPGPRGGIPPSVCALV